jgi:hypothetical protein
MKSEWINHKGKKIFYINCTRLDLDGLTAEFAAVEKILSRELANSVLTITDVSGFITSPASLELFKQTSSRMKKYIRKETVVGIKGIKGKFLESIQQFSGVKPVVFDDVEQAKDWLVSV